MSHQLQAYSERGAENQVPIVSVFGEAMSGRKYVLRRIADERDYELLIVSAHALGDLEHLRNTLQRYLREILFATVTLKKDCQALSV